MKFEHSSIIHAPVQAVFDFHEHPDALERLLPPWERVQMVQPPTSLAVGTVVRLKQRMGPIWISIESEHVAYERHALFVDEMRKGPFARWRHEHRFVPEGEDCRLTDTIEYTPPLGLLGRWVNPVLIAPRLRKMFEYRHRITAEAVASQSNDSP